MDEDEEVEEEDEESKRLRREETEQNARQMATWVLAILFRLKQEMDNRGVYQNPREELDERRKRAGATGSFPQ